MLKICTQKLFNMLNALQVSGHFIKKGVSPLKLQKLLFYSQVWYFVKNNCTLFNDKIEAWVLGPVVEPVWQTFRHMRRGDTISLRKADLTVSLHPNIEKHLDEIWKIYGGYTGVQLVDITHAENLWLNAREGLSDHISSKNIIEINDSVRGDFKLDPFGNIPMAVKGLPAYGEIQGMVSEQLF